MERNLITGPDFCAVTEDGVLTEFLKRDSSMQYGDILIGTVERMMPGIGSAFVDIGRKTSGFLPIKENSLSFQGEKLRSGMKIAVQIRKEETGKKGAFLTRDLTLAGKNILLMPMNRYIGISSRITDEQDREKLRRIGQEISQNRTGLVMRTAALSAGKEEIEEEAHRLMNEWKAVSARAEDECRNGTVLYHQDPVMQMIRDYEAKGVSGRIEEEVPDSELQRQLRAAGERTVRTGNGGNIVIDRCEAMTVIDVNSGSAKADGRPESAYLETNLSACETIAAQIRLRDLSGIILIDFIDLKQTEDREKVEQALEDALDRDRRKTVLHGWTHLGIMEMTRKRTGQ